MVIKVKAKNIPGNINILSPSQPFLGSSRKAPPSYLWGGALCDEPKNGCEGD